jgi:uncharacterized membrane protein
MDERRIHQLFVLSVILKGIDAAIETAGGIALGLVNQQLVVTLVTRLTSHELREDPNDLIANGLLHFAQAFSVNSKSFYAYYLVSHGAIKLVMVAALLGKRKWAYPFALVVMVLFIAYQAYEYSQTHSLGMLVLTVFDLLVTWLIWHEYRLVRRVV